MFSANTVMICKIQSHVTVDLRKTVEYVAEVALSFLVHKTPAVQMTKCEPQLAFHIFLLNIKAYLELKSGRRKSNSLQASLVYSRMFARYLSKEPAPFTLS